MIYVGEFESPLGVLLLVADEKVLHRLSFTSESTQMRRRKEVIPIVSIREELQQYFAGRLTRFQTPIAPVGTPFQQEVWRALQQIPFGETVSYRDIARRINRPKAARAVGRANGANPLPIIIPCHRVVQADTTLGGYSAGREKKERLLLHEAGVAAASPAIHAVVHAF